MPASTDLRDALGRLESSRGRLLKSAAAGNAEAVADAVREYRTAIAEVREGLGRLKDRVDPEKYGSVVEAMLTLRAGSDSGAVLLPERALGLLETEDRS